MNFDDMYREELYNGDDKLLIKWTSVKSTSFDPIFKTLS